MDELKDIRKKIDGIDAQLAGLFEQRMECAREIAAYKAAHGLSVLDPAREEETVRQGSMRVLDRDIREYYVRFEQNVISLSRDWQQRLMNGVKVAYSGVPGAFAHIAVLRAFPGAQPVAYPDFAAAYRACEAGECDVAVLPFENSSAGEEAEQNLLGLPGADKSKVRTVYSHPQALYQCAEYLEEHALEAREYSNTALAAQAVSEKGDPTCAAIGAAEAAALYGLEVLEARINTTRTNTTRFAAFTRMLRLDTEGKRKMGKHFILMYTVKNEAGSLAQTLNIIGAHNYNMCNLRSRPMKELLWNYYFFVELDGDVATEEGESMLRELAPLCDRLKLVGSFYTH